MVIGNNKVVSYLISGRPQISGFNTLLSLKVWENSSRFLPKGDLSSIFLCFCEVLSLFISTLVGNCVGYHKTGPILNPKSCTLQINPKPPRYFSGRTFHKEWIVSYQWNRIQIFKIYWVFYPWDFQQGLLFNLVSLLKTRALYSLQPSVKLPTLS